MPEATILRFLTRDKIEDPFAETPKRQPRLVPHYGNETHPSRRAPVFHGMHHDITAGPSFVDAVTKQRKNHGGFVKKVGHVIEIAADDPHVSEYMLHVRRDHDLWPADEATAAYCGVPFDPTFAGEHERTAPADAGDRLVAAMTAKPEKG